MDNVASDIAQTSLPSIEIEIDWEKYFQDFATAHGRFPVLCDDLLLFPDGWRYSSIDHMGPEYPPPEDPDELRALQLYYWKRRLVIVREDKESLDFFLVQLKDMQRTKTQPLHQRITYKNDEGQFVTESQPIDYDALKRRVDWLKKDIQTCEQKIRELDS